MVELVGDVARDYSYSCVCERDFLPFCPYCLVRHVLASLAGKATGKRERRLIFKAESSIISGMVRSLVLFNCL